MVTAIAASRECSSSLFAVTTACPRAGNPAGTLLPTGTSNHDWSEIYLAPYGWVPVDQYMGNYAMRYIKSLTSGAEVRQIRDFYFGGLDQYRMIANSDHSVALSPAKKFFRSDDVDFQRGELRHYRQEHLFQSIMRWFWEQYAHGVSPDDPEVSPLRLHRVPSLPPALVATAEYDVLRDDGTAYAEKLAAAGITVTHLHAPDMNHNFPVHPSTVARFPQSDAALIQIASWLRATLTAAT